MALNQALPHWPASQCSSKQQKATAYFSTTTHTKTKKTCPTCIEGAGPGLSLLVIRKLVPELLRKYMCEPCFRRSSHRHFLGKFGATFYCLRGQTQAQHPNIVHTALLVCARLVHLLLVLLWKLLHNRVVIFLLFASKIAGWVMREPSIMPWRWLWSFITALFTTRGKMASRQTWGWRGPLRGSERPLHLCTASTKEVLLGQM